MSWFITAIRWLIGLGLLGFGISLITREIPPTSPPADVEIGLDSLRPDLHFGRLFLGMASIIAGAIAIAPDLIRVAASPLLGLIDSIFLPGRRGGKPDLNLRLPVYYREQERYEDALAEYRKIIRFHPERPEGWIGAIELLLEPFERPAKARKLYERGRRKLRAFPDALAELETRWRQLAGERDR